MYIGRVVVRIGIIFEHVGPGDGSTVGEKIRIGKTNDVEMGCHLLDVVVAHFVTDLVSGGFVVDRCLDESVSDVGTVGIDYTQLGGERGVVDGKHERQGSNHIFYRFYLSIYIIHTNKKYFFNNRPFPVYPVLKPVKIWTFVAAVYHRHHPYQCWYSF